MQSPSLIEKCKIVENPKIWIKALFQTQQETWISNVGMEWLAKTDPQTNIYQLSDTILKNPYKYTQCCS